jgi:tRNA(fMet)-specific endonuclease VapC
MLLLDYSVCIALIGKPSQELSDKMLAQNTQDLFVPSIVKAELLLAARLSRRPIENTRLIEAFLRPIVVLPFDDSSAEEYAVLCAEPYVRSGDFSSVDLLTMATALALRATLVTLKPNVFSRETRLKLETW